MLALGGRFVGATIVRGARVEGAPKGAGTATRIAWVVSTETDAEE